MSLIISRLKFQHSIFYMHNLDTNFHKFHAVCKSVLANFLLPDGNVQYYPNQPKMSDLEIITLSILAEHLSISSENLLFAKLRSDYKLQFPNLLSRPRFNIRRRRLHAYINEVSVSLANQLSYKNETLIIDSAPIPICENARISRSRICRDDSLVLPDRGWHASHKRWYFGFKLQLIITESGIPLAGSLYPASCHDTHALRSINELQRTDSLLLADKGYISSGLQASLFEELKIKLITPLRSNMTNTVNEWTPSHRYKRKRIETTFSQLGDQFGMKKNYAKTLNGLITRIVTKIAAISVGQLFNHQNKKPLNHLRYALEF